MNTTLTLVGTWEPSHTDSDLGTPRVIEIYLFPLFQACSNFGRGLLRRLSVGTLPTFPHLVADPLTQLSTTSTPSSSSITDADTADEKEPSGDTAGGRHLHPSALRLATCWLSGVECVARRRRALEDRVRRCLSAYTPGGWGRDGLSSFVLTSALFQYPYSKPNISALAESL
jgi:hypothetical protein